MTKKFTRTEEDLEFLDNIRKELGDQRPKSFGLYVKLLKQYGREKIAWAFEIAKARPVKDKFRYFLGLVLKAEAPSSKDRSRSPRTSIVPTESPPEENLARYYKLRAKLIRKMTPKYERISRTRSRMAVKISRQERRLKRKQKPRHE